MTAKDLLRSWIDDELKTKQRQLHDAKTKGRHLSEITGYNELIEMYEGEISVIWEALNKLDSK